MRDDMMRDNWVDRLSEYVDGELSAEEQRALEAHLGECADCRAIVEELRAVVSVAASVLDTEPARDLWSGIAARIGAEPQVIPMPQRRPAPRRVSFAMWQLAAAAAVMLMVGGWAVWLAFQTGRSSVPQVAQEQPVVNDATRLVSTEYRGHEQAITELETALATNRTQLDTATVRVLQESLGTIDRAIADAKAALEQDPANAFLHRHLDGAMKKKIEILRRAVSVRRAQS